MIIAGIALLWLAAYFYVLAFVRAISIVAVFSAVNRTSNANVNNIWEYPAIGSVLGLVGTLILVLL